VEISQGLVQYERKFPHKLAKVLKYEHGVKNGETGF